MWILNLESRHVLSSDLSHRVFWYCDIIENESWISHYLYLQNNGYKFVIGEWPLRVIRLVHIWSVTICFYCVSTCKNIFSGVTYLIGVVNIFLYRHNRNGMVYNQTVVVMTIRQPTFVWLQPFFSPVLCARRAHPTAAVGTYHSTLQRGTTRSTSITIHTSASVLQ